MKKLFVIATLTLLASCATIDGIGQDISGGSRRVQSWL
ncbi:entericidin EcnA/B family protein [Thalassobius sp. Cn5-15]|nr:entericidin EcnA/B family protein [Thalassobius sp. Cn5-15]MCG7492284.1 entericidin EcnA/B family protein [Thalassobius sp. Cn5-15]